MFVMLIKHLEIEIEWDRHSARERRRKRMRWTWAEPCPEHSHTCTSHCAAGQDHMARGQRLHRVRVIISGTKKKKGGRWRHRILTVQHNTTISAKWIVPFALPPTSLCDINHKQVNDTVRREQNNKLSDLSSSLFFFFYIFNWASLSFRTKPHKVYKFTFLLFMSHSFLGYLTRLTLHLCFVPPLC